MSGASSLAEVSEEAEEKDESDKSEDIGKPPLPKSQKTDFFVAPSLKLQTDGPKYTWRIDLSKTESFWTGWYKGLSQKFLDVRVPKLLLLANIFGLDTTLTVGQMQGTQFLCYLRNVKKLSNTLFLNSLIKVFQNLKFSSLWSIFLRCYRNVKCQCKKLYYYY